LLIYLIRFKTRLPFLNHLSQSSPPLPTETNPLVSQQQANIIGAQTTLQARQVILRK